MFTPMGTKVTGAVLPGKIGVVGKRKSEIVSWHLASDDITKSLTTILRQSLTVTSLQVINTHNTSLRMGFNVVGILVGSVTISLGTQRMTQSLAGILPLPNWITSLLPTVIVGRLSLVTDTRNMGMRIFLLSEQSDTKNRTV